MKSAVVAPVPMTATKEEICEMLFDNVEVGDFSIMTDAATVWLSEQAMCEMPRQQIEMPRAIFNKLIKWYTEGVVPREDKRKPRK